MADEKTPWGTAMFPLSEFAKAHTNEEDWKKSENPTYEDKVVYLSEVSRVRISFERNYEQGHLQCARQAYYEEHGVEAPSRRDAIELAKDLGKSFFQFTTYRQREEIIKTLQAMQEKHKGRG